MDVSNAPVIPPSKFSKSSKVITKERWVAGVRPWWKIGFVMTCQANIYQVSGLSPTPNLVEHTPSTRGSPDETYHSFLVICKADKCKETHRGESKIMVAGFTNRPVRSYCCDLVKVHNFKLNWNRWRECLS